MIVYVIYYSVYDGTTRPPLNVLYKSNEPDLYPVFSPKYKIEINTIGSMTFTLGASHPATELINEMNTIIEVTATFIKNGVTKHVYHPFVGRVISIEEDDNGNKDVTCEGFFGTLNESYDTLYHSMSGYASLAEFEDDTVENAIYLLFNKHTRIHSQSGYPSDYAHIGPVVYYMSQNRYYSIDHIYGGTTATPIEMDSNGKNKYDYDYTISSLWDTLTSQILNKYGGFLLQSNHIQTNSTSVYCKYYPYSVVSSDNLALVPYPNEDYDDIQFARWDWIPYFEKGKNILRFRKENSITTKFSGVLPIGKDNIRLSSTVYGYENYYIYWDVRDEDFIWNDDLVSLYGAHIPYVLHFDDIDDIPTLRSNAQQWLNEHASDAFLPYKYTITGPEPCELGCGDMMIMIMRDVTIREDPSEDLINCLHLPCLSMEIDIQNPQNNTYVIGPFIDNVYTDTSISKFSAGNRR